MRVGTNEEEICRKWSSMRNEQIGTITDYILEYIKFFQYILVVRSTMKDDRMQTGRNSNKWHYPGIKSINNRQGSLCTSDL